MKLFNLTDRAVPGRVLYPQVLASRGLKIEPGSWVEVPDNFNLGSISGWINGGMVSVGQRPKWYVDLENQERRARVEARNKELSAKEEVKSSGEKKRRKSKKESK